MPRIFISLIVSLFEVFCLTKVINILKMLFRSRQFGLYRIKLNCELVPIMTAENFPQDSTYEYWPRWSRDNVIASVSNVRGFKSGLGRWIFRTQKPWKQVVRKGL